MQDKCLDKFKINFTGLLDLEKIKIKYFKIIKVIVEVQQLRQIKIQEPSTWLV